MTAIRGWAGLSQGTPLSQLHSQHAQPPGKLAEAVRLRLDPETQLPDLHDASESRQSYHHQERIAEPLAKPRQSADRPDDYWTTSMAKDGTQAPPSASEPGVAPEATSPSVWYSLPGLK
jgi:hypothetical protein